MPTLFNDELAGLKTPDSGVLDAPSSGIGIAPAQSAPDKEPSQGVFGHVQRFLFGVSDADLRQQREKKLKMEETKGFLADLENLTKLTENMDDAAKSGLIDTVAEKWEAVQPGYGAAVKTVGARPSLLKSFEQYLPHLPAPMQELAKRDPRAFLKVVGTAEGAKMLNAAADQPALRLAGKRRDAVVIGWQQLVPKDVADKLNADGVLTDAEIMEIQDKLPEKLRFTDEERDAIKRSKGMFWEGTGVLHGEKAQDVLADRAKKAGKEDAPQSDLGKLRADLDAKRITQKEYDAKVKKLTYVAPEKPEGAQSDVGKLRADLKAGRITQEDFDKKMRGQEPDDARQARQVIVENKANVTRVLSMVTPALVKSAREGTGVWAALKAGVDATAGNVAGTSFYKETQKARQELRQFVQTAKTALVNNPRFPVAEQSVVTKMLPTPDEITLNPAVAAQKVVELYDHLKSLETTYGSQIRDLGGLDSGARQGDGEVEARKTIGRTSYIKIKGQWYEER